MSYSLWPQGLQHARPPCPSPIPRTYSNSYPLSGWCHPTISSSVVPFSCLQFFPASGSFQMNQLFMSGGQRIGVWASVSVLPMNIKDLFPLGWTGWNSLQSKGVSRVFFNTEVQKHQFFSTQLSLWSKSHIHTWLLENHRWQLVYRMRPNSLTGCLFHFSGLLWWLSGKESTCQCRIHKFDPWIGKILWRKEWLPIPVFLLGKSHGQRSLVGCSSWNHKSWTQLRY